MTLRARSSQVGKPAARASPRSRRSARTPSSSTTERIPAASNAGSGAATRITAEPERPRPARARRSSPRGSRRKVPPGSASTSPPSSSAGRARSPTGRARPASAGRDGRPARRGPPPSSRRGASRPGCSSRVRPDDEQPQVIVRCGHLVECAEQLGQVRPRESLPTKIRNRASGRGRRARRRHRPRPARTARPARRDDGSAPAELRTSAQVVANDGRDRDHGVGPAGAVAEVAAARLSTKLSPRRPVRPFENPVILDSPVQELPERSAFGAIEDVERRGLAPRRRTPATTGPVREPARPSPQALVVRDVVDRSRAEEIDPLGGQLGAAAHPAGAARRSGQCPCMGARVAGVDADDHRGTLVTTRDAVAASQAQQRAEALTARSTCQRGGSGRSAACAVRLLFWRPGPGNDPFRQSARRRGRWLRAAQGDDERRRGTRRASRSDRLASRRPAHPQIEPRRRGFQLLAASATR